MPNFAWRILYEHFHKDGTNFIPNAMISFHCLDFLPKTLPIVFLSISFCANINLPYLWQWAHKLTMLNVLKEFVYNSSPPRSKYICIFSVPSISGFISIRVPRNTFLLWQAYASTCSIIIYSTVHFISSWSHPFYSVSAFLQINPLHQKISSFSTVRFHSGVK